MSASDRSTLRLSFARLARRTLGLGAYTFGAVTGVTHARFIGLRSAAERALARGNDADADVLAKELLDLAELYRNDWYYGNAIHHGNILRGRVALRSGDVEAAREF
jgi:hypothetical protein